MSNVTWKDATSYSQRDKERVPRVLKAVIGQVDVTVHRYTGLDGWFMSSRYFNINSRELRNETLEDCQKEALKKLQSVIHDKINELQEAQEIISFQFK